jgi:hypothetical protein
VLGGLVLALCTFFLVRALAKRKRSILVAQAPAPPPRPAHEVALERLEALRRAGHLDRGEHKDFYIELSEVLRAYAGGRYGFESIELTVAELIDALRLHETPGLDLLQLKRILDEADLVKFAKYLPGDVAAQTALNGAFELVERTRPRPAVEPAPAAPAPAGSAG